MVYFRKRLAPEVLGEINEMIIDKAQPVKQEKANNHDDEGDSGNGGTMIVDATCAPSNIKYPQDTSLLNGAAGSGSIPGLELPSFAVAVTPPGGGAAALDARLRAGTPPVIGRIARDRYLLDVRTIFEHELDSAAAAVAQAYL